MKSFSSHPAHSAHHPSWGARLAIAALFAMTLPLHSAKVYAQHSHQQRPAHTTKAHHIRVRGGWVRALPGRSPAAAYLTLHNNSRHALNLVAASSPQYRKTEIHQSIIENGRSSMRAIASLTLPPRQDIELKPKGYHLMLFQPLRTVQPGQTVRIDLQLSNQQTLHLDLPVYGASGLANTNPY